MNQTSDAATTPPQLSPAARALWAVLILATLYLCYFHNLGALGLVGPDEPRYAWIAREMAETGDWVTPRLYGKPWFEKPPLYYWGAALSFKIFGVSEVAARLPSALCALLATLAMAWLAWRVYGAETARWVSQLLPTTVGMIGFSHAAATDMPFAAMLTVAMVFAAKLLDLIPSRASTEPSPNSLFSFTSSTSFTSFSLGFFLGLATLAKGPAALILSGGGVLLWAVFTKRWHDALRCFHPVAIATFCLTALPWYILCARRNPDFFRVFIIEHNFKRFLTPEFQHVQPFWYYIPVLLAAVFPWTIPVLSAGIFASAKCWQERQLCCRPATVLICCWAIFCLLFFSISQSKLPGYILPAVPVVGLCLARSTTSRQTGLAQGRIFSLYLTSIVAAMLALGLAKNWLHLSWRLLSYQDVFVILLWAFGLMFLLLAVSFSNRIQPLLAISLRIAAIGIFLFCSVGLTDKRLITSYGIYAYSTRDLSQALKGVGANPQNLRLVHLRRSPQYQLNFYFHAELKEWNGAPRTGEFLVGESITCRSLNLGSSCKDLWGYMDKTDDWELLQITQPNLPGGLGGGADGGSAGYSLKDGQARQEK